MKIRNMLLIGSGISIIFVIVFSSVVYVSFNIVAEENERELNAQEIHKTVSELDILMYEYLTYREERMSQQWNLKYDATAEIIEKTTGEGWGIIKSNYADLKDLFSQITANYETQGNSELEERLITQFLIKSYEIISDSSAIAEEAYNNAIEAQKTANNSMIIALIILIVTLVGISFYTSGLITKSLSKLRKGTEIIGKGNLEHKIDVKSKDELGELATAFNQMAGDLKEAQDRLVRSEKLASVGKLAGIMGHEIRNPLGVIKNSIYFLNMKLKDNKDEKIEKHLNILQTEINNSDKIISDVLDFARIKTPALREAEINDVVKETLSKATIPKAVKVKTELGAKLPKLKIDTAQIEMVFANIISNAVQAMPEGGVIKVTTNKVGEFIAIAFKDTGVGIPKENLDKIFEPLISTKVKGIGLGLTACQSIIKDHKGKIEVKNKEVRKGVIFTVKLPVA